MKTVPRLTSCAVVGSIAVGLGIAKNAQAFSWEQIQQTLAPPSQITLGDPLVTRWSALSLADITLKAGDIPRSHDAAAFVSSQAIGAALDLLEGTQLVYGRDQGLLAQSSVTLERIDLVPGVAQMTAAISLRAASKSKNIALALTGEALVLPVAVTPGKDNGPAHLRLRLQPTSIRTAAEIGFFSFGLKSYWASLAADLVRLFADPSLLEVQIPFVDRTALALELDETRTEKVNDAGATITFHTGLPPTVIEQRFTAWPPLIVPGGIWVLARRSEKGQISITPSPPPMRDALPAAIAALESNVAAAVPSKPARDVEVFLSGNSFAEMARRIGSLPTDKRTLVVETKAATGRLAEVAWKDNVLGSGGAYAELADAARGRATLELGVQDARWGQDGLAMALSGRFRAAAPIHVHVDPLIGGGVGTTIGVEGASDGTLSLSAKLRNVATGSGQLVVVEPTFRCDTIAADVASDGRLKADFGWMSVPRIGARIHMPVGRDRLPASPLIDTRPHFVRLSIQDPDGDKGPWQIRPAWGGAVFRLAAVDGTSDAAGLHARADLRIQPVGRSGDESSLKAAGEAVETETQALLAQWKILSEELQNEDTGCNAKSTVEIVLGDLVVGSNNEIVKFLRNAWNDLTKGPGDSNDAVKAGKKIAEVLNALSPHDEAARALTHEIADASARVFGADNPVTKTFAGVDKEVNKALNDPARAAIEAPRNVVRETTRGIGNVAREGKKGVDNVVRGGSNALKSVFR